MLGFEILYMADTVWIKIVALFDGFFHQMSLFVVFTVFTSIVSLFLAISFQTPLEGLVGGFSAKVLGYKEKDCDNIREHRSITLSLFEPL